MEFGATQVLESKQLTSWSPRSRKRNRSTVHQPFLGWFTTDMMEYCFKRYGFGPIPYSSVLRIIPSTFQLSPVGQQLLNRIFSLRGRPIVKFKQISKNDLKEFMVNHEYPLISFIAMENNLCKHGYCYFGLGCWKFTFWFFILRYRQSPCLKTLNHGNKWAFLHTTALWWCLPRGITSGYD